MFVKVGKCEYVNKGRKKKLYINDWFLYIVTYIIYM